MSDYALHPGGLADIDEIWEYNATDSLDAADRAVAVIFDSIAGLAVSPQKGHRPTDLTSAPLLFWRVYSYLIAMRPMNGLSGSLV